MIRPLIGCAARNWNADNASTTGAALAFFAAKKSQHVQGPVATATSVVTLLIGATSVLASLSYSLQSIFQSPALKAGGFGGWLRRRFLSLGFILTLGFLLMVSLTLSTGLASLRAHIAASHPALLRLLGTADVAISLLLTAVLFSLIFRYMPARKLTWSVVMSGGLLTAVLGGLRQGKNGGVPR